MKDVLSLIGIVIAIALVVFPLIKICMAQAEKAAKKNKAGLALLFTSIQFIIFFAGFTLMMFFALAFISTRTNLF